MKLWLLSQNHNNGYDTYDSAVVAAETEDEAKAIHPGGADKIWNGTGWAYKEGGFVSSYDSWAPLQHISIINIGEAVADTPTGILCASFNAG